MHTECNPEQYEFSAIERRRVVARFDGGQVTSDGGALLLKQVDEALRLSERVAGCFLDGRKPWLIEHTVKTLVGQRLFAIALGYEDLNDHDELRKDPLFGVLAGRSEEHTSELQSQSNLVCRLLLEKKKNSRHRRAS